MPLGMEVDLGSGHIVLDGGPIPTPATGTDAPSFRPMSIVAKRPPISATTEHLLILCDTVYLVWNNRDKAKI